MMLMFNKLKLFFIPLIFVAVSGCKKDTPKQYPPKKVTYEVTGSNFRLNFIDSNSAFQEGKIFQHSFKYEFKRGPGFSIGISIFSQTPGDTIFSWRVLINDKLHANGFSEGGAYFTIPYD